MNLESALDLAAAGRLYPAVILHGGERDERRRAAVELARTLLCDAPPDERPCGVCRHCRRVTWPGEGSGEGGEATLYHPDFQVLERDLKTATSVEATRELLKTAQVSPFEARGQVFVVASAESLSGEAANALLKALEEPHLTAPRNFLLLAPSRLDLLPTLRSRSLSIYLGAAAAVGDEEVEPVVVELHRALAAYSATGAAVYLLAAAAALAGAGGWEDPRAGRPWAVAARAVVEAAGRDDLPRSWRRPLLELAGELLEALPWRLRGISPERILEGLVARHLAGLTGG